jgi:multidrug transporter EmrE-like cation transporter
MTNPITYLLVPLMALLLVTAQATWGTAIKKQHVLEGPAGKIIGNLITSPRIWLGIIIYVGATVVYFLLLSKAKFFSVQVSMTAISILFSTLLAAMLFDEKITPLNLAGMILVLDGLPLVLSR